MSICLDYIDPSLKDSFERKVCREHLMKDSLRVEVYPNSVVLPYKRGCGEGGVVTYDHSFVANTTLHEEFTNGGYSFDETLIEKKEKDAIYIGSLFSCYGHAVTDNLKKIWFLFTEEGQRLMKQGAELICIAFQGKELAPYVFRLLFLAGVPINKLIIIDHVVRYRNVFVPDHSLQIKNGCRYYTKEFRLTLNRLKANASFPELDLIKYDKVYFSRTALNDKRDFGEKNVEKAFNQCGYTIFHPEHMTIEQQIQICAHCSHFAATEGSVSHNSIFCEDGTTVEILRKANYVNDYQDVINSIQNLNVVYIDVHHTIKKKFPWGGPFYLSKTKYLRRFLHLRGKDLYWLDKQWYAYLLREVRSRISTVYYKIKN